MGTVPAPNIAQDAIQLAQMPQNAAAEYARVAQLNQQTRAAQLENQQKQIAVQDQQAGLAALKDPAFKSMNDLPDLLQKHGASFNTIMGARSSALDYNTKLQAYTTDQLKNESTKNDLIAGHIDSIKSLPPEQQAGAFEAAKTDLVQRGAMTPQEAQQTQYPGTDGLDAMEKMHMAHSSQIEDQLKQNQGKEAAAKARQATAAAAHEEFVNSLTQNSKPGDFDKQVDALVPPTGAQGQAQNQFVKGQVNGALSRGDLDSAKKFIDQAYQNQLGINKDVAVATNPQIQQGKVDVAKATALARQQAQAGQFGEPGDPMIDMVGQNRVDLATALQRVPPAAKEKFLNNLAQAYPEYQQQVFATRQALMKSATSGDIGKNITAYNTAIAHATQLQSAAEALNNGDMPTLNKLGNALGYQFGSDKTTNFNVIKNALSGEISKVFKGGEATDAEIKAVQEPFSSANSPAQLKGAIDNAIHLMNSKRDALQQQYQQGLKGQPNFGTQSGGGNQGGGKTLSMAAVQRAAKDHGVSVDEAKRQAQAAGYTIQ